MAERGTVVPGEGAEFIDASPAKGELFGGFIEGTLASGRRLLLLVIFCLFPLLAYVFVDLPPRAHIVLSMVLVAAGIIVARRFPHLRLVIVFISLAASLRYFLYRATETVAIGDVGDTVVSILLLLAEGYALVTLIGGYFQSAVIRRNRPVAIYLTSDELPWVDVLIPTYNESLDVLRPTVLGALAMEYPHKTVYVLDDGHRDSDGVDGGGKPKFNVARMCRDIDPSGTRLRYISRPDNSHAKAGNLNHALYSREVGMTGSLVAFFDADHVPVRSFLSATVGFFLENERLALVQTPHHFINPDPFIKNLYLEERVPPEQHLFYHGIQLGNDFWNSAFFCGSCAVIRREALDEERTDSTKRRGISYDTVTEDAHTALQIHAAGWDSLYLDIPLAAGLATESFAQHIGQRIRWARGMAQIVRLDNPLFKQGLSLAQRLNYFNAAWHFFNGLPRLIFVLTPALYLVFDLHPVNADVREVLVYAIPHLVLVTLGAVTAHRNVRHSLWPEVYDVAIAPYTALVTVMAMLFPRWGKFNVTDKGTQTKDRSFDFRHALPLLIILGMQVAAMLVLPAKLSNNPLDTATIWVAAAWNIYNVVVVGAAVLSAVERPQRRRFHRVNRRSRVLVTPLDGSTDGEFGFEPIEGDTVDVSQGGLSFELTGEQSLPSRFLVTLISPSGRTMALPCDGLARYPTRDGTGYRVNFADLDTAQQTEVVQQIYGESNSWIGDRFTYDRYLRSVGAVLMAIVAALFGNPRWLDKLRTVRALDRAPLIPGSDLHDCDTCGAVMIEGANECEACGAVVGYALDLPPHPAPLTTPEPQRGFSPMVLPAGLLVVAVLLAVGFSPVVNAFSAFVPMQRWEQVTHQTRLGEMAQAWHAIDELRDEFKAFRRGNEPLPEGWRSRLWTAQRDYKLFQGSEKREEVKQIHAMLVAAVLDLNDAADQYQKTFARSDDNDAQKLATVTARVASVDANLATASRELRLP